VVRSHPNSLVGEMVCDREAREAYTVI
jgi:hypothetical protein